IRNRFAIQRLHRTKQACRPDGHFAPPPAADRQQARRPLTVCVRTSIIKEGRTPLARSPLRARSPTPPRHERPAGPSCVRQRLPPPIPCRKVACIPDREHLRLALRQAEQELCTLLVDDFGTVE